MIFHLPHIYAKALFDDESVKDMMYPDRFFTPERLEQNKDRRAILKMMQFVSIEVPCHCDCEHCDYDGTETQQYVFDKDDDLQDILTDAANMGFCEIDDLEYTDPRPIYVAALIPQFSADTTPLFRKAV